MYTMVKALVAGGAGFIGSHLCEALLSKGYFVICIDNLISGREDNIKHLENNSNFEFIKKDVAKDALDNIECEYIFDLASPASPADYAQYPEETALTNSLGTLNLLKLALKKECKFLFTSTSEVYGDPLEHPQKETYWGNVNSFGPRACYDESKRFAEALIYVYLHKYDIDARIVRLFNTYGPRLRKDDGRVVSNFIISALNEKPLDIYGDGKQTRSFCYVADTVSGIIKAMESENTKGEIFNLGNPDEHQIIEFAQIIKDVTGSKSEVVFKPLPKDDPLKRKPDITKAKEVLNWEPKVNLNEGLVLTIEYYQKNLVLIT